MDHIFHHRQISPYKCHFVADPIDACNAGNQSVQNALQQIHILEQRQFIIIHSDLNYTYYLIYYM